MRRWCAALLASALAFAGGCASVTPSITQSGNAPEKAQLEEVAKNDLQWTGIGVARDGRILVNFPRWSENVPVSVGVVRPGGAVTPFLPALNNWAAGVDPANSFVCVQSVVVDAKGFIWILDPANPQFKGVVPGGPKLLKVDPQSNSIIQTVRFAPPVITQESYLNDVRIDTRRNVAYITDSGSGAIVVVDLASGESRRLLANDRSTRSEGIVLNIEGKAWRRPDGSKPEVHADGIALDSDGRYLYYHALTGRTLYRIDTQWLRDPAVGEEELGRKVERMGETGPADGMEFGPDGRLYVTALEENAIKVMAPGEKAQILVRDPRLAWPDTLAFGPDGSLYVTTSQIHRGPNPPEPYQIFKVVKE